MCAEEEKFVVYGPTLQGTLVNVGFIVGSRN